MSRALAVATLLTLSASAEVAPDSPDHANHFQSEPAVSGDVTATAVAAWARQAEAKLRVKFDKGTDDYLLVAKNGARISMESGEFAAKGKDVPQVIDPVGNGTQTFVFVDPEGGLHTEGMTARLDGVWLARTDAPSVEAEPFSLPLNQAEISAGGFECHTKGKVKQETQEAKAKFECTYQGAPGTVGLFTSSASTARSRQAPGINDTATPSFSSSRRPSCSRSSALRSPSWRDSPACFMASPAS